MMMNMQYKPYAIQFSQHPITDSQPTPKQ